MPRRAEWRRLPDEPQGGIGLLRVCVRDAWVLPSIQQAIIAITAVSLALIYLTTLFRLATPLRVLYLTSLISLASTGLVGLALFRKLVRRYRGLPRPASPPTPLPASLESILPLPLPENTFPVHLAVRYQGVLTGLDLAAASFVDGWLHVEGRRASFALRAGDARAEWRKGTTLRVAFPDDQSVELWLVDGLKLEPYFRHAATLWVADRDHPEGESILPPLAVQPSIRAGRLASALLGAIVPLGIGGFLTLHASRSAVGGIILATVLLANAGNVRTMLLGRKLDEADRRACALPIPLPPSGRG